MMVAQHFSAGTNSHGSDSMHHVVARRQIPAVTSMMKNDTMQAEKTCDRRLDAFVEARQL
jgi:hypothetical protein